MSPAIVFPHQDAHGLMVGFLEALRRVQSSRATSAHMALKPIPVVMPSVQFADWFQTAVARQTGLCMGIEFMTPRTFVSRALNLACQPGGSRESSWTKGNLTWRIFPHVPQFSRKLGIEAACCRDRFAIAALVADQLDQYSHFRPEMIQKWQRGGNVSRAAQEIADAEAWQRDLWQSLNAEIVRDAAQELHPALLLESCAEDAGFLAALQAVFPELFVVGTGSLDPLLVQMLRLAGKAGCSVEAHVVLPSLGYLGEIRKRPAPSDCSPEDLELPECHPLLVSMGRHAVGAFLLLGELDENYAHWPSDPPEGGAASPMLLHHIQSGIRNLLPPTGEFQPAADDISLRVHSCFGPRREMEALKDELLRAFRDLPGLKPEEVVIVTPSPEIYGPLAGAVLEQSPALPIRLMELPASEQDAMAEGLLALLSLRESSYEASVLLELLRLRAVRARLGIADDADALDRLQDWIESSGLTRGLGHSGEESRPIGSWKFARERLIAGCWMGDEPQAQYAGHDYVLPLNDVLNGNQELKEAFLQWHWRLAHCLEKWNTDAPLEEWSERLGEACDHLLASPDYEEPRQEIQPVLNRLQASPCGDRVDAATVAEWLRGEMEESARRSLPSGKISLGRFKQLQHIPCRVLAMVGMAHGSFPRQNRTPAWDLLRIAPKAWDRNARIDDRQLFLDALLTPSQRLIITAPTRNVRSGKSEPFSACVDELLWTVQKCAPGCNVMVEHRLQPFAPEYFEDAGALPRSFDAKHLKAALSMQQASPEQARLPLFATAKTPATSAAGGLLTISLEELERFWRDPAKAFLKSLGIALHEDETEEWLDRTPLALDHLQAWNAKEAILQNHMGRSAALEYTRALLLANRQLPAEVLGQRAWEQYRSEAIPVGEAAAQIHKGQEGIHFAVPGENRQPVQIAGRLSLGNYTGRTVLDVYRVSTFSSPKHFLKPWIETIIAAAAGKSLETCLIDPEKVANPLILSPYAQADALELLNQLIHGYLQGQVHPLCYAPETSEAYANACMQWEAAVDTVALGKAMQSWNQDDRFGSPGEGQSATSQLAWRDQDPFANPGCWHEWSRKIAKPLLEWRNKKA